MSNEQDTIHTLFDPLTPTTEQRERMWQNIQNHVTEQKGEPKMKRTKRTPMRTIAVAAVVVLLLTGCVCAAVPAVRNYLNTLFLQEDSTGRIGTVPKGWTGIYTADDLEKIREDLSGGISGRSTDRMLSGKRREVRGLPQLRPALGQRLRLRGL